MRFVLDENLPPAFARALNNLASSGGDEIVHVRDFAGVGARDDQWIPELVRLGGGIIVSGDRHILTREHELRTWRASRLTIFVLTRQWSPLQFWEKAALLVRWWPKLTETAARAKPGAAFAVPMRWTPRDLQEHR